MVVMVIRMTTEQASVYGICLVSGAIRTTDLKIPVSGRTLSCFQYRIRLYVRYLVTVSGAIRTTTDLKSLCVDGLSALVTVYDPYNDPVGTFVVTFDFLSKFVLVFAYL